MCLCVRISQNISDRTKCVLCRKDTSFLCDIYTKLLCCFIAFADQPKQIVRFSNWRNCRQLINPLFRRCSLRDKTTSYPLSSRNKITLTCAPFCTHLHMRA
ncbi:hypothetical protein DPEC_G00037470 [Dallia pectoralis]|uniref:Uncharacterized protein n=1 Tax=Dallia pectoralis TaxID=75939 RepID=A0ACC2HES6_DALPE|nr:hypothetical protein DPEC_G00037470 [Dallia pectoralis]